VTSVVNRYYDPTTDQFISIDPQVATTNQPYVFTNDNPLNSEDPLGLTPLAGGEMYNELEAPVLDWRGVVGLSEEGNGAVSATGTDLARALGIEGESLSAIDQAAKVRIESITGSANYRIPDSLTGSTLLEVKNVSYLSYTSQVKDFLLYSESKGLSFELVVRENTVLSNTIRSLVTEGRVVIVRLLPGR